MDETNAIRTEEFDLVVLSVGMGIEMPQESAQRFKGAQFRSRLCPLSPGSAVKIAIDKEHCIYFLKGKCRACEKFCPSDAIDFSQTDRVVNLNVGSVIIWLQGSRFSTPVRSRNMVTAAIPM